MESNTQKLSLSRVGFYQLSGRTLGKGSFAKVYETTHRHLGVKVALKTMNITEMKDGYMKRHFKREALLLSRLNHPGIVALFEVMRTNNHYCIALEYGGENLCDYVRAQTRGRLNEITSRSIARQLASAVSHIHERGVVHRDIKLENILINPLTKKVKISDFGLSNEWDKKILLTTHCGSPEYAAPELHSGMSYGFEVDIWALGVVFFAMVVGRLPFEVELKKPVSNQHRRELFLNETKRGVKTMKHQSFMGSASFLFKDLMLKMLNPSRQLRLDINKVENHPWVIGVIIEEFSPIDETWMKEAHQKYAKLFNKSIDEIKKELSDNPYGQLGGFFNIEKHRHQCKEITLRKAPSVHQQRLVKTSVSHNVSLNNRPTTTVANNFISDVALKRRPKTTNGKIDLLKSCDEYKRSVIN